MRSELERALSELEWEMELRSVLGHPVRVAYGRSRSSPLQARAPSRDELARSPELRGGLVVRMHAFFATAPPEIRRAIASWIRSGRRAPRATRAMSEWMNARLAELPPLSPQPEVLETSGRHHDLARISGGLIPRWFSGDFRADRPRPALTWGRRARSLSRSTLRLGSYEPTQNLVRVHPVLDQPGVPDWFVRYILFHEILHAALPQERDRLGRILHHGPEFRRREASYADFERALRWERRHVNALIRSARSGRPFSPGRSGPRPASSPARCTASACRQLDLFAR